MRFTADDHYLVLTRKASDRIRDGLRDGGLPERPTETQLIRWVLSGINEIGEPDFVTESLPREQLRRGTTHTLEYLAQSVRGVPFDLTINLTKKVSPAGDKLVAFLAEADRC